MPFSDNKKNNKYINIRGDSLAITDGYQKYKKVEISTASQNRLIVMLYDGAIKFLESACVSMDKKHGTEEAHNNIVKAQEIIYELLSSLNYEAGEIADRPRFNLYLYESKINRRKYFKNKTSNIGSYKIS